MIPAKRCGAASRRPTDRAAFTSARDIHFLRHGPTAVAHAFFS